MKKRNCAPYPHAETKVAVEKALLQSGHNGIVKGDAYIFMQNDGSKAILNYNIAQSLNPKSPFAKLRVGQLWMRARNYNDALTYYQEVVKIDFYLCTRLP